MPYKNLARIILEEYYQLIGESKDKLIKPLAVTRVPRARIPRIPFINPELLKIGAAAPKGARSVGDPLPGEFVYEPYDPAVLQPVEEITPAVGAPHVEPHGQNVKYLGTSEAPGGPADLSVIEDEVRRYLKQLEFADMVRANLTGNSRENAANWNRMDLEQLTPEGPYNNIMKNITADVRSGDISAEEAASFLREYEPQGLIQWQKHKNYLDHVEIEARNLIAFEKLSPEGQKAAMRLDKGGMPRGMAMRYRGTPATTKKTAQMQGQAKSFNFNFQEDVLSRMKELRDVGFPAAYDEGPATAEAAVFEPKSDLERLVTSQWNPSIYRLRKFRTGVEATEESALWRQRDAETHRKEAEAAGRVLPGRDYGTYALNRVTDYVKIKRFPLRGAEFQEMSSYVGQASENIYVDLVLRGELGKNMTPTERFEHLKDMKKWSLITVKSPTGFVGGYSSGRPIQEYPDADGRYFEGGAWIGSQSQRPDLYPDIRVGDRYTGHDAGFDQIEEFLLPGKAYGETTRRRARNVIVNTFGFPLRSSEMREVHPQVLRVYRDMLANTHLADLPHSAKIGDVFKRDDARWNAHVEEVNQLVNQLQPPPPQPRRSGRKTEFGGEPGLQTPEEIRARQTRPRQRRTRKTEFDEAKKIIQKEYQKLLLDIKKR